MRKLIITTAILALTFFGCSPAKKIVPPTPGVSDVTYNEIELKDAPQEIKDLADKYKGRDTATVAYMDEGLFLLITKETNSAGNLRIKKATNTVTYDGGDQLKIDVENLFPLPKTGAQPPLLIAKINLNRQPEAAGIEMITKKGELPPPTPPASGNQQTSTYLSVYEPSKGAVLTSPFTIKGKTRVIGGTINIKLQDNAGQTLAQTSTTADQQGNYETRLSYNPPLGAKTGKLTVSTRGAKSLHVRYIRVTVK